LTVGEIEVRKRAAYAVYCEHGSWPRFYRPIL
jgi:hypothetical protein